jgi:uncharacterized 2Fe-2S/4Fe-4S cluster protein (DUF4445 family)
LPPKGICGSGVIDLAARLFQAGMIDVRGKLVPTVCGPRVKTIDGQLHLVVVAAEGSDTGSDLTISQADLDSLIRSKAAMYTILETITASVGIAPQDLESFYVAGTFGAFINPASAITIGMLPDLPLDRYKPLGNSSLGGAAPNPRPHHLSGAQCQSGFHEPLQCRQIFTAHQYEAVSVG